MILNARTDYPENLSPSNPTILISQARLLLLRTAAETPAWCKRQVYRQVADGLHIYVELLERLSNSEVQHVR